MEMPLALRQSRNDEDDEGKEIAYHGINVRRTPEDERSYDDVWRVHRDVSLSKNYDRNDISSHVSMEGMTTMKERISYLQIFATL